MPPRPTAGHKPASPSAAVSGTKIRVLCVDDSHDITAVLKMILDAEPDMKCVGCLATADDLVAQALRVSTTPSNSSPTALVLILDATMPGKDPLKALRELAAALPWVRTIIYSGYHDKEFIRRAFAAGAHACISKSEDPAAITRAVREVAARSGSRPGAACMNGRR
jgi:DNA-binding NarL/FixJ family response regulator